METTNEQPFNLIEKYKDSDIKKQFETFKQKVKGFTDVNEELNLKTGDTITFIGGYDSDILYLSEILGFNSQGHAFILWDCFWLDIELKERDYKKM